MALLVAAANGNLTTAATWGAAETGTGAQLTNPSALTNTTTSYVYSSAFTGTNANVCDGVAFFCKRVNTTGTVTIALSEDNGTTATREVTVNASDLPADEAWVFFKFGSTLTLDGGTDYKVGVKASSAGNATFYRDGTAGNWARVLRLTAAPGSVAAADTFLVAGEWTAAGSSTARTVTMDSTAATDYGNGTATATAPTQTNTQAFTGLQIGQGGTLTWASSAATNYTLRLSGNLVVWSGGTYNQGTTATPCPRDSTMTLEFDCAADGDFGFLAMNGATVNIQGQSRTSDKNIWFTRFNTDEAVNSTSLGVADDTGWLDNDVIMLAGSSGLAGGTGWEQGALNGNAGASTLTVDGFAGAGGGIATARLGSGPAQSTACLMTRNVVMKSVSTSFMTYFFINNTAVVDIDWCEFAYFGVNVSSKRGINVTTTTGSFNMQYSCLHDTEDRGLFFENAAVNNFTIRYCLITKINSANIASALTIPATTGTNWVFSDVIIVRTLGVGMTISDYGGTINNIEFYSGAGSGIVFSDSTAGASITCSGIRAANCNATGITISDGFVTLNAPSSYFHNSVAFQFSGGYSICDQLVTFTSQVSLIRIQGGYHVWTSPSTTTTYAATTNAIIVSGSAKLDIFNGVFANNTNSINVSVPPPNLQFTLNNCTLSGTTEVLSQSNLFPLGFISSAKHDQTAGAHRTWKKGGTIERDTTIFNTAAPSERLTPISASVKLIGGSRLVAVDNTATKTISVYVRKSVIGDGAAYNGAQPRLILRRNDAIGITSDTVLDTMTAAAGTWEQLSGTTAAATDDGAFEVHVDCDGIAGWVNVDDWTVT